MGEKVRGFAVGDHVAFSYVYCDHCHSCLCGEPYYCENYNEINFGGTAGDGSTKLSQNGKPVYMLFGQSSATHAVVNSKSAVKVDKDVDLAMIAPLGCGIQTGVGTVTNIIKPRMRASIAVFGIGAVGLSAIMGASIARCQTIIAVGGNPESLKLAKELGATHTINCKEVESIPAAIKAIVKSGVDYAIDTSGHGPIIEAAIHATKYHGEIHTLAPNGILESLDVGQEVLMNMRTIKGSCEGDSIAQEFMPELVYLYKQGKLPLDKLIKVYDFEDINQAPEDSGNGLVIKPVLRISD